MWFFEDLIYRILLPDSPLAREQRGAGRHPQQRLSLIDRSLQIWLTLFHKVTNTVFNVNEMRIDRARVKEL